MLTAVSLYYRKYRFLNVTVPAPWAFARRVQFTPVLKYKSAIQTLGRFHDKSPGMPDALAHMLQVIKRLPHGKVGLFRQFLEGEWTAG